MRFSSTRLRELIEDADYWRGPTPGAPLDPPFKEWQHFVVFGEGWSLLFNLSLDRERRGRVVRVLDQGGWHGSVVTCASPELRRGRLDAAFGGACMRWSQGCFEICAADGDVRFEILLEPCSVPSLSHNIRLGAGASLSWCLVPRLRARGWIEHDGRRVTFDRRAAYHDHNWGRFAWGGEFSWEWGCAMPDDAEAPWTVIFARMNDRFRHRTTATSLFVLRDGEHVRYLRDAEVQFDADLDRPSRPAGRVPAAMALVLPDADADVARTTRFVGRRDADEVRGVVDVVTRGQVLVPSEIDACAVVRLNEASTRVRVSGQVAGTPIAFEGPGMLEVTRG